MSDAQKIVDFIAFSERLKQEMRHSWISDGRRESVAEHTWQMALMAVLTYRHLEHPVDIEKSLKMIIVHDLIEAEAGDIPFFETSERQLQKAKKEQAAIEKIRTLLPRETGNEIYDLWHEFEQRESLEARFVKALDNLEVQLQHNLAGLDTWEEIEYGLVYSKMDPHCSHDSFLKELCDITQQHAEKKMFLGGIDVEAVKQKVFSDNSQ